MQTCEAARTVRVPLLRAVLGAGLVLGGAAQAQALYGIGQAATPEQIAAWNIDVGPDGRNLPLGSASVAHGRELFASRCASCHGANGEGGLGDRLVGGQGSLASANPVKTVGSYWPYATTLFDYIRRAMPLNAPQSLADDEVYAVTGFVLYLNGLVAENTPIDARLITTLQMPNRDGFIGEDPRPDVKGTRCFHDCLK